MGELRRRLEDLSGRGEPRGAARVWQDATTDPAPTGARRLTPAVAFLAVLAATALVGTAVVNLSGSGPSKSGSRLIAADRLDPLKDCNALLDYLKGEALTRVGPYGLEGAGSFVGDAASARESTSTVTSSAAKGSAPAADASILPSDTSSTNVQEVGVDEPDIVKTDGQIVYTLANGRLSAVRERGAPALLGTLALENPVGMLLDGDRLLVVGGGNVAYAGAAGGRSAAPAIAQDSSRYAPSGNRGLTLTIVDVRDPAAMKVVTAFQIDSSYVSARMVDGVVRVVTQSSGPNLAFVYPANGSDASIAQATKSNRAVVNDSTLADWLPSYTQSSGTGGARPAYDCARTFAPPEFAGFGLLSVLTIDPTDPHIDDTTSVVADGQTVYASTGRLYVATTRWQAVAGDIASTAPVTPDTPVIGGRSAVPQIKTLIHAFDISGTGPARYRVSGEVRGTVLNQFSLSEYQGRLRVATTDQTAAGSESFVTVLADDDARLARVGQVGGMGRGEQIKSVRFVDDRGYVVTFRQTDPLYVLDLADPAAPKVTGELKILGYSAYLHPLAGNLLIGVGQDADESGRIRNASGTYGVQVSLFDVADPANPKRLQQTVLANVSSQVGFDHHAFLYWPATGLTVVPVQRFDVGVTGIGSPGSSTVDLRSGAVGLRVAPGGIDRVAQIRHPVSSSADSTIERSLVIGDRLVTVSASGLLSSDLATLQPGTWVPLA